MLAGCGTQAYASDRMDFVLVIKVVVICKSIGGRLRSMVKKNLFFFVVVAFSPSQLSASRSVYSLPVNYWGPTRCNPAQLVAWTEGEVSKMIAENPSLPFAALKEALESNPQRFLVLLGRGYRVEMTMADCFSSNFRTRYCCCSDFRKKCRTEQMRGLVRSIDRGILLAFRARKETAVAPSPLREGLQSLTEEGYCVVS